MVAGVKAAPAPPPVILFTKGGGGWIEPIAATGCEAVGLEWTQDLGAMSSRACGSPDPQNVDAEVTVVAGGPGAVRR